MMPSLSVEELAAFLFEARNNVKWVVLLADDQPSALHIAKQCRELAAELLAKFSIVEKA